MPDRAPILFPLRRTASDAEAFARVVHAGQVDKAGRPYVEHLERVAKSAAKDAVKFYGFAFDSLELDNLRQIAWLHDVMEDHGWTTKGLADEGFSERVRLGVLSLTNDMRNPYQHWIKTLCAIAPLPVLIVKLADMEDNADPERLALLPDDVRARLQRKYEPALALLRDAITRHTKKGAPT